MIKPNDLKEGGSWCPHCGATQPAVNAYGPMLAALKACPLRGKVETGENFDDRQTAWLRDYYNPAIALAKGEQS